MSAIDRLSAILSNQFNARDDLRLFLLQNRMAQSQRVQRQEDDQIDSLRDRYRRRIDALRSSGALNPAELPELDSADMVISNLDPEHLRAGTPQILTSLEGRLARRGQVRDRLNAQDEQEADTRDLYDTLYGRLNDRTLPDSAKQGILDQLNTLAGQAGYPSIDALYKDFPGPTQAREKLRQNEEQALVGEYKDLLKIADNESLPDETRNQAARKASAIAQQIDRPTLEHDYVAAGRQHKESELLASQRDTLRQQIEDEMARLERRLPKDPDTLNEEARAAYNSDRNRMDDLGRLLVALPDLPPESIRAAFGDAGRQGPPKPPQSSPAPPRAGESRGPQEWASFVEDFWKQHPDSTDQDLEQAIRQAGGNPDNVYKLLENRS